MALSKITSKGILDGTIQTADIADNAVNTNKIGADVITDADIADNAITTNEIQAGAVTANKLGNDISLGGFFKNKDGSDVGTAGGKDALFRVNLNATTNNVTIDANNNASVTGPLTIGNGTTLSIANTGRLVIL